ncbi:MAG: hypothetical protein JW730_18230 [Anaerolineales bacterium]|nr:hypothetical protein [Anaerolineales bacterium]
MKLIAKRITRDEDGNVIAEEIIGKHAIITDMEQETMEAVMVEAVEVIALTWSKNVGLLQVELSLGGYDHGGNFQADRRYQPALVSWSRDTTPELWQRYDLDNFGAITEAIIKPWLHAEESVYRAARDIWKIPGEVATKMTDNNNNPIDGFKKNNSKGAAVGNPPQLPSP